MRSISFLRAAALATLVFASMAGTAQIASPQVTSQNSAQLDNSFSRGRTVAGKNSAELLQRAQRQKVALQKKNAAQQSTTSTIQPNVASTLKWAQLGPAPANDPVLGPIAGRATAVAVDPTDTTGNTVYVGGAYGGLWRSTNAATLDQRNVVWTQLLDSAPTLSVGAIAVRPDNGKLILLGTGTANATMDSYYGLGILRSEDGGGTWTQIPDAAPASGSTRVSFKGVGFSRIAFSKDNANLVVAAASIVGNSAGLTTCSGCTPGWGLFYSTDAGKTWTAATFKDGTAPPAGGTGLNTVVYNAADKTFYAAVSYHGLYSSTDGATWTRLANQPFAELNDSTCATSAKCPIYRAEFAARPGSTNQLYVWITDVTGDRGIFVTKDSGATWTALDETGIANCEDTTGCGATAAAANLALAAVPNGDGTDVYAGASNIFKCSINAQNPKCEPTTAPFINLTHVFGCNPAKVHAGQHGIAFSTTNTNLIYFANDGGIYRTLNGTGLTSGVCTPANPIDNLNGTMGAMMQLVSFSQLPADDSVLLAGTPTSGSISTNNSVNKGTNGLGWNVYAPGFGVFDASGVTAINPDDASEWFVSTPDVNSTGRQAVNISRCANGTGCKGAFTSIIDPSKYDDDSSAFPAPFILDPQATNQMILGTCRVWRGSSNPATAWSGAISPNFTTNDSTQCAFGMHIMLTSLAAGGPKVDGVGSKVIYAGDETGHIHVTGDSTTASATWTTVPAMNATPTWGSFPISSIVIDTTDATGSTAYMTVQGFNGTAGHVFKTTDMGATWTKISGDPANGGVPDAPANSVTIDPKNAAIVYVGTDVGVFMTSDNGAHWAEYGPTSGAGVLPNVPVTKVEALNAGTIHKLRASTYGRGMWEIPLASFNDFKQVVTPSSAKVRLGGTTTFTATYTALGAFSGDIAVTCTKDDGSALPDGFTCTPSPATVTTGTTSLITITTDATKVSAGDVSLRITGTSGSIVHSTSDPDASNAPNPIKVTLTDFAVSAVNNQNTATVTAGDSATFPITVTTSSGLTDAVTLSCTSTLPDKTSCSWDPATIVPGATSNLTVKTTAATTAQLSAPAFFSQRPLFAIWFGIPGIVLAGAGANGRRRKLIAVLLLVLALASVIGFVACGGGSKSTTSTTTTGTPAGTYTITVTGTDGTLTRTTTLTLVVK